MDVLSVCITISVISNSTLVHYFMLECYINYLFFLLPASYCICFFFIKAYISCCFYIILLLISQYAEIQHIHIIKWFYGSLLSFYILLLINRIQLTNLVSNQWLPFCVMMQAQLKWNHFVYAWSHQEGWCPVLRLLGN